jgi:hypothetical protein
MFSQLSVDEYKCSMREIWNGRVKLGRRTQVSDARNDRKREDRGAMPRRCSLRFEYRNVAIESEDRMAESNAGTRGNMESEDSHKFEIRRSLLHVATSVNASDASVTCS